MRRYEIRDDQWDNIKDLLPAERKPQGGRPPNDHRQMLNAMLWIARTGAPWRDLPEYYGSWSTVYSRFRRWKIAGIWDRILEHVTIEPDYESVMIDATIVRVHQHGAGAKGGPLSKLLGGLEGGLTTKIHAVVDALGNPLHFVLTGGQCHDSVTGYEMLKQMDLKKKQVLADRAYDTNRILHLLKEQSATSVIPSKKNRRNPRNWDKEIYKERHLIECFFNKVKKYRRLATRYDKLACTFKAFLTLASIMVWLA
ncbi:MULTISPECIES: IS5 family transposase [Paenibacillus]|uniref:IS5 family transposase n=1 Tax=Paenibacillus TaxID=44249 RepID=UPI0022B928D8|nr:IS5 family transposase [Paenibacillus caseinilyticus]MCZ8523057.1 IS5 family transposase [Paenibacillus caseinilyticus]